MNGPIRIVVVDDHDLYRTGLALALGAEPAFAVLGQGASAADALALADALAPDMVLLDLDMPGGGLAAAAAIRLSKPDIKVVILTFSPDEDAVRAARRLGARGYILKGVSARELARSLAAIHGGASCWPSAHTRAPATPHAPGGKGRRGRETPRL